MGSLTGGPTQANNEIANIINMADGIYRVQLGLTFQITFQHVWTTPDPYRADNASNTIVDFRNYWNANFPVSSYPRDTAHLFTGKFPNTGLAYLGVICVNPSSAYGLSGRIYSFEVSWIVLAHEVGHNLGAAHVDTGDCANTIMNTVASYLSDSFCQFSVNQIVGFVNTYGNCLQEIMFRKTKFDFDGDGKADISVFRPSEANWYVQKSQLGFSVFQFGISTDKIAPADYDGDGKTDYAVFRPSEGNWYIRRSSNGSNYVTPFGISSDIPVPADYDGDGKADIAIFRPLVGEWWYIRSSDGGNRTFQFGNSSDKPVPDDFTGDGKADIAFWRPSDRTWYIQRSEDNSFYSFPFGLNGDIPTTADFDGDKKADSTIFRPSTGVWYILRSTGGTTEHRWGSNGDIPVPADYDGDGLADIVVWRPSNGVWYALNTFQMQLGGQNGDIPIPGFLVAQ